MATAAEGLMSGAAMAASAGSGINSSEENMAVASAPNEGKKYGRSLSSTDAMPGETRGDGEDDSIDTVQHDGDAHGSRSSPLALGDGGDELGRSG